MIETRYVYKGVIETLLFLRHLYLLCETKDLHGEVNFCLTLFAIIHNLLQVCLDDSDTGTSEESDNSENSEATNLFEGDDAGECNDGADNDRDGLFDCDDPDCAGSPSVK